MFTRVALLRSPLHRTSDTRRDRPGVRWRIEAHAPIHAEELVCECSAILLSLRSKPTTAMLRFVILGTTLLLTGPFSFGYGQGGTHIPHELIVQFKGALPLLGSACPTCTGLPEVDRVMAMAGIERVERIVASAPGSATKARPATEGLVLLRFDEAYDLASLSAALLATGEVWFAEPNHVAQGGAPMPLTPNDQYHYNRQWSLYNDGSFNAGSVAGADISMREAWDITTGSSTIVAAILDSGLKLDHSDVAGRVWSNADEVPGNGMDDDGNGFVDDHRGWDFVNVDNDPTDDHGHGTNVAGLLGATGSNGIGYAGVDWNCELMIVKVLNSSNLATYANMVASLYYAVSNGADVINMSIGGEGGSLALAAAVDHARVNGVVVVVSMGNTNDNVTNYPAGYAGVIAVGATDTNDERVSPFFWSTTSGSSYGAHIDLVAPGNLMYGLSHTSNNNYSTYWGGTSQAAPLVCGVAGLMKALDPTLGVDSIRSILMATADDEVGDPGEDTPGWDEYHGAGRLNAYAALDLVRQRLPKTVEVNVMLGGPFDPVTGLMHDSLRTAGLLPLLEPFTALGHELTSGGGEALSAEVLSISGPDAIVDWVVVELRSSIDPSEVRASRAALLQRDGTIVDLDGTSPLVMRVVDGAYHVAVRHRNHLGAMSNTAIALTASQPGSFDFMDQPVHGNSAQVIISGTPALWPGNVNGDGMVRYCGAGNDRDVVLSHIGGAVPTNVVSGYHPADVNMDGSVSYTGTANDRDRILDAVGGAVPTRPILEQLP